MDLDSNSDHFLDQIIFADNQYHLVQSLTTRRTLSYFTILSVPLSDLRGYNNLTTEHTEFTENFEYKLFGISIFGFRICSHAGCSVVDLVRARA